MSRNQDHITYKNKLCAKGIFRDQTALTIAAASYLVPVHGMRGDAAWSKDGPKTEHLGNPAFQSADKRPRQPSKIEE